jgi:hypothetical protein
MSSAREGTLGYWARATARHLLRPLSAVALSACVAAASTDGQTLGPKDLAKFTPTDTGRIAIGMSAPDFTLESLGGPAVTLSALRGRQRVILVFYRGHW